MSKIEAIRDAIKAASEQPVTGHARGKFALEAAINGLDHLIVLPEPWETVTDIALRRVLKPAIAHLIHELYEDAKGNGLPSESTLRTIREALALAIEGGAKRDEAIDAAADAAIAELDARLNPKRLLGEQASDLALRLFLRPIIIELAAEGADALDGWTDAKPKPKPRKKKTTPKE